jgi:tetraacyldisaccharide 4'-kinase
VTRNNKILKTKGIYFLYRLLQALLWPFLLAYFVRRGFENPTWYRTLRERFGFLPRSYIQTTAGAIWLHAVSVGEVQACLELVKRIDARYPRTPVFVSVTTLAGRALADQKLTGLARVFYAPIDYVFAVRRVLRVLRPSLVVIAETEIWPNLLREARRTGCGILFVNARISDKTAPSYARWRWFFGPVLRHADLILAQSSQAASRFIAAGAPPERVVDGGNLKFDFTPRADDGWLAQFGAESVWIASSTMPPDEDEAVIAAFRELAPRHPRLLLVLAPRKPERFDETAAKLMRAGIAFVRRTSLAPLPLPGVLLLDTIGELSGLFASADVVFMGGSLVPHGGHNVLEPAFFGKPTIVGPHMQNFQTIADHFRAAGALVEIGSGAGLAPAVERLLHNPGDIGERARRCAEVHRGAAARAMEEIVRLYGECYPRFRKPLPELIYLWPLSLAWTWAGARRQRRLLPKRTRLATPVVSIGNVTMGGTGKTPFVLWLSRHMPGASILTRGHGRQAPEKYLILPAGASAPVRRTGDEPQIFLRAGVAPVGIGPDRAEAGRRVERQFAPQALLLDDGFQHIRLARDLDIVLIDALNPFGGGYVFPMGKLREPLSALARADVFALTRADCAPNPEAITTELRRWNPQAPVFRARTVAEAWVEAATGLPATPELPAAAFCGLGNPHSFWCTLEAAEIAPVDRFEFADHHVYRPAEIERMAGHMRAAGAMSALTTEKDWLNLCEGWPDLFAPLKVYWLRIGIEVEGAQELLELVRQRARL